MQQGFCLLATSTKVGAPLIARAFGAMGGLHKYPTLKRSLDLRRPTIHKQLHTIHEAGVAGSKKQRNGRNFFRTSHLSTRNQSFEVFLGCLSERIQRGRIDGSGTENI